MENGFLNAIINLLEKNKSFPNYHAERRIDIFINFFMKDILTEYLEKEVKFICPEFPLKKEEGNLSTKLDYLYKTNDEVVFVELKTDVKSFDIDQMNYYFHHRTWKPWEEYLIHILDKTKHENYITLRNELEKYELFGNNLKDLPIRVIYVSPELKDSNKRKVQLLNYELINFKYIDSLLKDINEHASEWNTLTKFFKTFKLGVFEIIKME